MQLNLMISLITSNLQYFIAYFDLLQHVLMQGKRKYLQLEEIDYYDGGN